MRLLDNLAQTVPIRDFTPEAKQAALSHILANRPEPGGTRWASCILHGLYFELTDRPDLQDLVLELCWITWRMAQKLSAAKIEDAPE